MILAKNLSSPISPLIDHRIRLTDSIHDGKYRKGKTYTEEEYTE
ncbi:hypothetical protein PROVRUST_08298 [Providencia rustigianii DSM 4541]|uniref:Uncharacterized protein n=1 Tax=Providencia rustigianii DSM 4541 TaxID=500637 RepID=D1P7S6_9GAMM|nr:hypothetical protein PROVRUST_08298 [Providencia rustigianii DSM 4541]